MTQGHRARLLPAATRPRHRVPAHIDATGGSDASAALQRFVDGVPNGSTIVFKAGGIYRMDLGLKLSNRRNLVFEGNGATLRAMGPGNRSDASLFALWGGDSGITIRNFTLVGNNPDAGTVNAFHGGYESQAGVLIWSASDVTIEDVTMRRFYGDCVNIGPNSTHALSSGIVIRDVTCSAVGRAVVAMGAVNGVTIERVSTDQIGSSVIAIEPDYDWADVTDVVLRDSTIGSYGLSNDGTSWLLYACGAQGSTVRGVTVSGNTVSGNPDAGYDGKALALNVLACGDRGPRRDIVVRGNTSTQPVGGTDLPIISLIRVDGATVTGNRQPVTSGEWARFPNSTNVTVADNDLRP